MIHGRTWWCERVGSSATDHAKQRPWDRHLQQAPRAYDGLLQEVERAYTDGALLKEIAKQVDVGHQRLSRFLRARDVIFHDQSPTSGGIMLMRATYEHGASLERVSERLEHTGRTVRGHLSSAGTAMRDTHRR